MNEDAYQPPKIVCAISAFRDMVCFGEVGYAHIALSETTKSFGHIPAGGLQLDASMSVRVSISNLTPFIDGWYHGFIALEIDAYLIGKWRSFLLNVRNSDCPTVVHFEPTPHLVGWEAGRGPTDLTQYVYSVAIRPTIPAPVEAKTEPDQLGTAVLDAYGRNWTLIRTDDGKTGWNNSTYWYEPREWADIMREAGPLWPLPLTFGDSMDTSQGRDAQDSDDAQDEHDARDAR